MARTQRAQPYRRKDYRVNLRDYRVVRLTVLNFNTDKKLNAGEYRAWQTISKKGNLTKEFKKFEDFLFHLGKRPEGAKLARYNGKEPHSPLNSFWYLPRK